MLLLVYADSVQHACQEPNVGLGQQYELLDWLSEVTFPMEARFEDVEFARKAYTSVIKRTIDYGVRPSFSGLFLALLLCSRERTNEVDDLLLLRHVAP